MEYMWMIFVFLALLVIVFYKPNIEKMTNKDLLETLSTFGKKGTTTKTLTPYEEPIYGPKAPKIEEPEPSPSNSKNDGSNTYPDIYGPEITPIPGKTHKRKIPSGKHTSDDVSDDTYEFNPDMKKAFPTDENEPQPFLTDFSKFQR